MKTEILNLKNEKVGDIDLPEGVFGIEWKPTLVKQVILAQLANKRRPWAHAKDRSEVRGGGKKPWRQKGTGRARHGSTRSPLWIGGGKAHGPNKERDYSQDVPKKMKRTALFSLLSKKVNDSDLKVIDSLTLDSHKTKDMAAAVKAMLGMSKNAKKFDILFISNLENKNLIRAVRNLEKTKVLDAKSLNAYDLANFKRVYIEEKAVPVLSQHYKLSK